MSLVKHSVFIPESNMCKKLLFGVFLLNFPLVVMSQDTSHIGDRIITKEEFIDVLTPKQRIKTRGIRFNNTEQPDNEDEVGEAPTIAMAINFEYDSAELTSQAKAQLDPLGQALNSEQLTKYSFGIDGHTDATGGDDYNMELSKQRALAVGTYLYASYGIVADRLLLSGKGETELYDQANPGSGVNRRVEISTIINAE